ncbi:hypothetical protein [Peterkaempfera griseoplana]|nr:hypothetical protein [Peterkaempfera griseoplana]
MLDAFDQTEARDPKCLRPWIVLVHCARHQIDLNAVRSRREA